MNKSIKYFCHFDLQNNEKYNRYYALSASQKIEYILDKMNFINFNVDVISLSTTRNNRRYPAQKVKINENTTVSFFPTLKWGNKIRRFISRTYMSLNVIIYIIFKLRRYETVLLYHTLEYANIFYRLFKIKKINLILQLEELYQDVLVLDNGKVILENKMIALAKSFIISNELLSDCIFGKPYVTLHGNYKPIDLYETKEYSKSQIHLVYAGTFMKEKGVERVIMLANYLPSNYVIHIYGFGSHIEVNHIMRFIAQVNIKSKCKVAFEGIKTGNDFITEISKYDFGLSLQDINSSFNNTSFPSKILTYLRLGLNVISTEIESIRKSDLSDLIHFSQSEDSKDIAEFIMKVQPFTITKIFQKLDFLDEEFTKKLKRIIDNRGDAL